MKITASHLLSAETGFVNFGLNEATKRQLRAKLLLLKETFFAGASHAVRGPKPENKQMMANNNKIKAK